MTVSASAFEVMLKPRGSLCNLDCQYCYFLSKERLYPGSGLSMQDDLLERFTQQYIEAQSGPEITFAWQGGEPTLMGLDFFRRAVALQAKYRRPGTRITNALQTNATLLDDDWGAFLHDHNFLVGVSLDGPRALHDAYRVDKGGRPTFERVMAGVRLLQKHAVELNVLTTVHAANVDHPHPVYHFLRDEVGARFIQFIPIVERVNATGFQEGDTVTARSVAAVAYGRFLNTIFDDWVRRDVGQVFVQMFDVALGAWLGQPGSLCVFAPTCGHGLALEHNGDVYSCDHFVEPKYRLGNIQQDHLLTLAMSEPQQQFGRDKRDSLPHYCRECSVRFACHGGCPKDRFIRTPEGEAGLNYLCAGYKLFFEHVDQPMRLMTTLTRQRRPPAAVMALWRPIE